MHSTIVTALIVATALFMENMDGTVLATSLPAIAKDMGQDPIVLKLALTSYMLTLAVFIPASGWVADKLGARTVFSAAIVVFTLGSIACGASVSLPTLIAARVFQGLGGAMMVPVGRLVLLRSVPKTEIVSAMAYLTIPALIGPVVGPPLGGFITTYFHWRWIFWINVPIGMLGLGLTLKLIENVRERDVGPFDFKGFLLSGVGLLSFVFGLTIIGRNVIPAWQVAALIGLGVATLVAYVGHARRVSNPIIDLSLLKLPTFTAGVVGGMFFRVGIGALPFLLPLLLQLGFGLSPFESGSLTFAAAAGAMGMKVSASFFLRRFGFRRVLIGNGLLSCAFLASYSLFGQATPHLVIFLSLLIGGYFRSLEFTALNAIGYADVAQARMSRATSFASVVQQMSSAIGVAVAAASIEVIQFAFGDTHLATRDMNLTFIVVAGVSLICIPFFMRLTPDAGAEVSGKRAEPAEEARVAAA
jgi:EmrB/QacA subfamily drug resistance transporter